MELDNTRTTEHTDKHIDRDEQQVQSDNKKEQHTVGYMPTHNGGMARVELIQDENGMRIIVKDCDKGGR